MRYLEDLRDKKGGPPHEGKEIWIVGCGKSQDDFPDDFFDNKVAIGLNLSFVAFPSLNYFLTGHREVSVYMVRENPKLLKRSIWVLGWQKGKYDNHPRTVTPGNAIFGKYKDDLIYVTKRLETRRRVKVFKEALQPTIKDIIQKKEICHFIGIKTILGYGIQCAIVLGARKITLVGCEARTTEHSWHAQKRGMHDAYARMTPGLCDKDGTGKITYSIEDQTGKTKRWFLHREGVRLLAEAFASFGIEVRRYYYKSGYEDVVVKEVQ